MPVDFLYNLLDIITTEASWRAPDQNAAEYGVMSIGNAIPRDQDRIDPLESRVKKYLDAINDTISDKCYIIHNREA